MGLFLGAIGMLGFPIALLICAIAALRKNKKLKKQSLIAMGITFALFVIGLVIYKPEEEVKTTEPKQEKVAKTDKKTKSSSSKKEVKKETKKEVKKKTDDSSSTNKETKPSKETVPSSSEEVFDPNKYQVVDYNEWNHDKVELGTSVQITGNVIQVQKSDEEVDLRVALDDMYDQVVLVAIAADDYKDVIAEDDNVTIYGMNMGITSYETVMGNEMSLPLLMSTKYVVNSYGQ
ncbi:tripartite tricarboxylate transporter TctB family protein [Streptococcus bovimastitidis]|nr:tripartite tricarboxylate transporter TctB family protein [Streptococcus bovimastitidis]